MHMRQLVLTLMVGAVFGVLAGCGEERANEPDPSVVIGEQLFAEHCSECHPRSGRGDYLKRIPVTLLTMKSQHELMEWIRGSGEHREMPSFENLSDEERAALADYLHSQIMK